jgi:hypothetical protein
MGSKDTLAESFGAVPSAASSLVLGWLVLFVVSFSGGILMTVAELRLLGWGLRNHLWHATPNLRADVAVGLGLCVPLGALAARFWHRTSVRVLGGTLGLACLVVVTWVGDDGWLRFVPILSILALTAGGLSAPAVATKAMRWVHPSGFKPENLYRPRVLFSMVALQFGTPLFVITLLGLAGGALAKISLVSLGVAQSALGSSATWLLPGLIGALFSAHGLLVMVGTIFAAMAEEAPSFLIWGGKAAMSETAGPDLKSMITLGRRTAIGAHISLALALTAIYSFGLYARLPRTFLGGRPPCVAGSVHAALTGGELPVESDSSGFTFDRMCVLSFTSSDVVLCGDDLPPAQCVIVKRDKVETLITPAGF